MPMITESFNMTEQEQMLVNQFNVYAIHDKMTLYDERHFLP